jgi:xylose isomerase
MAQQQSFNDLPQVKYEGPDSKNALSFRYYDPDKIVNGKSMKDHLRFSAAAWHTVCNEVSDPFGPGTISYEWAGKKPEEQAEAKQIAVVKFAEALSIPYFCFHGRDLFTDDADFAKQEALYHKQADKLKTIMGDHDIKLGWGTENLFSPLFYAQGALNAADARVAARAMAEIGLMGDITKKLGGESYVLWGGRVGYTSRVMQSMEKELGNMGNVYRAIVGHFSQKHPNIQLLEEPKAKEPTIFQYSRDVATTLNFLRSLGPEVFDAFKMNVEGNHAELAGLTLGHELEVARINGKKIGGIDANSGVAFTGWDVDRYQENFVDAVDGWDQVDRQGGLGKAVINHDAKPSRTSTDIRQKMIGHVMAMDLWARALLTVEDMKADGTIEKLRNDRYRTYDELEIGKVIKAGTLSLEGAMVYARANPAIEIPSGNHEELMCILQRYLVPK